ncbi:MAG: hypothetical protein ABI589_02815 [Burkholderiales bacterium]
MPGLDGVVHFVVRIAAVARIHARRSIAQVGEGKLDLGAIGPIEFNPSVLLESRHLALGRGAGDYEFPSDGCTSRQRPARGREPEFRECRRVDECVEDGAERALDEHFGSGGVHGALHFLSAWQISAISMAERPDTAPNGSPLSRGDRIRRSLNRHAQGCQGLRSGFVSVPARNLLNVLFWSA